MAKASRHAARTQGAGTLDADIERTAVALTLHVIQGGDLVVLGGPARNGRPAVLGELERRLPADFHPLPVSTRSAQVEDLLARILDRLQLPRSDDPPEALRRHIERMQGEGVRPVLIVNDGYRLSNQAVLRLLTLCGEGEARMPVVLATSRYERCLRALERSGARVSLVELGGAGAEPHWREPLRSVEELLADLDPSQPSAAAPGPSRSAPLPADGSALESGPVRASRAAPARVTSAFDRTPPTRPPPPAPARRAPARRSRLGRGIAVAGMVAALGLAFALRSFDGRARDGRPIAADGAGDPGPAMAASPGIPAVVGHTGELPASGGSPDHSGQEGDDPAGTDFVVADVRQAIAALEESDDAVAHAAARQFLADRGPDPVGYELLAELDARRAASPGEAVRIITARSRVRTALCAAWAYEGFGEAAVRLGCPGAGLP